MGNEDSIWRVIDQYQTAFVEDWQILVCSLIANELIDSRLEQRGGGVIFKVDIMKAYDHMSWNNGLCYGIDGFWGKVAEMDPYLHITCQIKGTSGSREGLHRDPLSPLFFILVTEHLSKITFMLMEDGTLDFFTVSRRENGIVVLNLQFADDTIIF